VLQLGRTLVAIDERIAPEPGEQVIVKKRASGFHGTYLPDTSAHTASTHVIITGVTMAAASVTRRGRDRRGLPTDRRPRGRPATASPGVTEWNLFDIDAKFGDVEPLERVVEYLDALPVSSGAEGRCAEGVGAGSHPPPITG
jgi:N-carbamoylsarcosine amidase